MRIDANWDSPRFWALHFAGHHPFAIKVDGKEVKGAVEADDEIGYVNLFETNSSGALQVCECGQQPMTRLVFGRVEIIGTQING